MSQDKPSLEQRVSSLESVVDRLETAMQGYGVVKNSEPNDSFVVSVAGEDCEARFCEKLGSSHYRFEYVDTAGFCIVGIEGIKEDDRERLHRIS